MQCRQHRDGSIRHVLVKIQAVKMDQINRMLSQDLLNGLDASGNDDRAMTEASKLAIEQIHNLFRASAGILCHWKQRISHA